ncbi:Membrane associated serine protease, rhomboid family [Amycolatopsis xylanica]|uniref:Membrane associated serine protease, rhomboid family n=1 Tax=Amycolatopsis xylanica TaxID=589385 RepID=A0A1H3DHK2_9PSEU|nr:rhomboid family intramembrane serine protease [Amycolatopsis xylanica]SDX65933.1 Membrane associated serine protease, rhomboid family [Amycolatopsis xylanica]
MSTLPTQPTPTDPAKRILPPNPQAAAIIALGFTLVLYLVELADVLISGDLDQGGIHSRDLSGLAGVIWAPLLHGGWSHLFANTVPVLVFSFLAMAGGLGQWIAVTATIWILGGLGVWLTGPSGAVTVGASGLAFGWLAFLLVRGIFNRSAGQIVVAVVLLGIWSGMLWGLLPGNPGISWQGHLFGALSGVLAAWLVARASRKKDTGSLAV